MTKQEYINFIYNEIIKLELQLELADNELDKRDIEQTLEKVKAILIKELSKGM